MKRTRRPRQAAPRERFPRPKRAAHAPRRTVLLVCEGEKTEPNYFWALVGEEGVTQRCTVTVKKGEGRTPELALRKAMGQKRQADDRQQPYDEIWVVVDVETRRDPSDWETIRRQAAKNSIRLCLSNPCFEVWFLMHFGHSGTGFLNARQATEELNKLWNAHFDRDYDKGDEGHYEKVAHLTDDAIKNAKWVLANQHAGKQDILECNSATEVYELVEHLWGREAQPAAEA